MSGIPEYDFGKEPIKKELTEEEFADMKREAKGVVLKFERQQKEKENGKRQAK